MLLLKLGGFLLVKVGGDAGEEANWHTGGGRKEGGETKGRERLGGERSRIGSAKASEYLHYWRSGLV